MRRRNWFGLSAAFVAAVCFVGSYAMSQDKHGDKNKPAAGAAAGGMDDSMMKSMMEAATPGPQHKALAPMAGKFKFVNKFKMDPSQDWQVTEGTYEGEMGLDGRYLLVEVQADMMGMPFQGMGVMGYDNTIKKYVAGWIDNMGTGVMRSEGTSSDGGKTIVFNGEMMCPIEHVMKAYKYQYEIKSNDEFVMRWWTPSMSDKKVFESMVITYTREK